MDKYQEIIYYTEVLNDLKNRLNKVIHIPPIIKFMSTIGWYWSDRLCKLVQEKHAENSAKWIQKFINGYLLEVAFYLINSNLLSYIESNHEYIKKWSTGKCIPDFSFTVDDKKYTIDTKTYFDVLESSKTFAGLATMVSSFHGADFGCMFCMTTRKFYWFYKICGSYSRPCLFEDLPDVYKNIVKEINLPDTVEMLTIEVPSKATDDMLPEYASYHFTTYNVIK